MRAPILKRERDNAPSQDGKYFQRQRQCLLQLVGVRDLLEEHSTRARATNHVELSVYEAKLDESTDRRCRRANQNRSLDGPRGS